MSFARLARLAFVAGIVPAMTAAARADDRDLVIAAADGPVRVRLRVLVDGRPFEDRRAAFVSAAAAAADRDRNGRLSDDEWRAAFRTAGLPDAAASGGVADLTAALAAALPPAAEITAPALPLEERLELYAAVDADGDGRLAPAELAAAPTATARYDADGDGILTPAELAPTEPLAPTASVYADSLPSDRFPFRWERSAGRADATVEIRLIGRAFGRPRVAVADASKRVAAAVEGRKVVVTAGGLTIDLDAVPNRLTADDVKRFYLLQMRQRDADKNGYLDEAEFAGLGVAGLDFRDADGNGDGMVYPDELAGPLDALIARQTSRVRVEAAFERPTLFARFDADGDRRLTRRELSAAAAASEGLSLSDFGGRYRLSFAIPSVLDGNDAAVAAAMAAAAPDRVPTGGPAWFAAMDRNGDSDVTAAEFLGDATTFSKLDTDSDGLLTADEATAADEAIAGAAR